jgi:hypothetical protein
MVVPQMDSWYGGLYQDTLGGFKRPRYEQSFNFPLATKILWPFYGQMV